MLYDGERIGRLARATEVLLGELRRLRDETETMLSEMETWPTPARADHDSITSSGPYLTLSDEDLAEADRPSGEIETMAAPPSHRDSRVPTHRPAVHAPLRAMAPPPFVSAKGERVVRPLTIAGAFAHAKSHRAARRR